MKEIILCKYGEIVLKGLNRGGFENELMKNMRRRLKPLGKFDLRSAQSTLYITPLGDDIDMDEVFGRASKVFGITKLCRAIGAEKDIDSIAEVIFERFGDVLESAKIHHFSRERHRVAFKRLSKTFGVAIEPHRVTNTKYGFESHAKFANFI